MARKKEKQKRVGVIEQKLINKLIRKIKNYRIFKSMEKQGEVKFNDRLLDYIRQNPNPLDVNNKKIPVAKFVGEQFRPEFYLTNQSRPICGVECKRLTDKGAKSKWKEGLSQALLYSNVYKAVILVFFDFTESRKYCRSFGRGNSSESRFSKSLREQKNIHLIVLKAE